MSMELVLFIMLNHRNCSPDESKQNAVLGRF
jgi:hypothetical protein